MALPAVVILSLVTLMSGCERSFGHRIVSIGENELTIRDREGEQQTHEVAPDAKITLDRQLVNLKQLDAGDAVNVKTEEREGKEVATEIDAKAKETIEAEQQAVQPGEATPALPEQSVRPHVDTPLPPADVTPQPGVAPSTTVPEANVPEKDFPVVNPEEGAPRLDEEPVTADPPARETFKGKISSISAVDNRFVVTADNGDERRFTVNDDTKYSLDGKEATFGDLMVDHKVNVSAERDGEAFIAKSVDARTK
jgi:hypothetical protein